MKKYLKILSIIVVLCVCIICSFCQDNYCYAEDASDIEESIQEKVDENLDKLDMNDLNSWLNSLGSGYSSLIGEDVKTAIKEIINGEFKGGLGDVFKLVAQDINRRLGSFMPILVTIIAICILQSIVSSMSSEFLSQGVKEIIFFVCYSAVVVLIAAEIAKLVSEAKTTVSLMQGLMNIVFPILLTMVVALGGTVSSSIYQPLMVTLSTTVSNIITKFIFPCFIVATVLSLIGNISKSIKLGRLEKFLKSATGYIMGVIFSLFVTFLTFQGLTGGVADTVFIKGAKFALKSYIPVLGGYLSDGFDLMLASVVLIKNSVGLVAVLAILALVLMPIIKILILSLGLKLAAGLVEPFADSRFSGLLEDTSKNLSILLTCILGVAFMFLIIIMMIIFTCNLGVV